mmetsp:Transcript_37736/g.68289  ORF Transcript_37736/g.68289 Transcript_37736/m.68289 type:complete len:207 (-) Transcript_37736:322-942(-)
MVIPGHDCELHAEVGDEWHVLCASKVLLANRHPAHEVLAYKRLAICQEVVDAQQRLCDSKVVQGVDSLRLLLLPLRDRQVPACERARHGEGMPGRQRLHRRGRLDHDGVAPGSASHCVPLLGIHNGPHARTGGTRHQWTRILPLHSVLFLGLVLRATGTTAVHHRLQNAELVALTQHVQVHLPNYKVGVQLRHDIVMDTVPKVGRC